MGGGHIFWYMSHRSNELKGFILATHNVGSKGHSTSTSTFTLDNQKTDMEPLCILIPVVATRVCNNSLVVFLLRLSRKDWFWIVVMTSGIQEALLSLSVSYHLTNAQVGTLKNSKVMWTFSANKEYWIVGWHWLMAVSHWPQRVEKQCLKPWFLSLHFSSAFSSHSSTTAINFTEFLHQLFSRYHIALLSFYFYNLSRQDSSFPSQYFHTVLHPSSLLNLPSPMGRSSVYGTIQSKGSTLTSLLVVAIHCVASRKISTIITAKSPAL